MREGKSPFEKKSQIKAVITFNRSLSLDVLLVCLFINY